MRLLHLIPRLHYTSAPVKQRTDVGTSPSLQRRRGILYCLMRRWGNIITSAESSKVKPECCSKCPNIGGWQSWKIICPNKFQSRHQIWVIIASQWISEHSLTCFLWSTESSPLPWLLPTILDNTLFCPLIETNQAFLEGKFVTWACSSSRSDCLMHATLKWLQCTFAGSLSKPPGRHNVSFLKGSQHWRELCEDTANKSTTLPSPALHRDKVYVGAVLLGYLWVKWHIRKRELENSVNQIATIYFCVSFNSVFVECCKNMKKRRRQWWA